MTKACGITVRKADCICGIFKRLWFCLQGIGSPKWPCICTFFPFCFLSQQVHLPCSQFIYLIISGKQRNNNKSGKGCFTVGAQFQIESLVKFREGGKSGEECLTVGAQVRMESVVRFRDG